MAVGKPSARIDDIDTWLATLTQSSALAEVAVLLLCVGLAWGLVWGVRRASGLPDERSIWFGRNIIDGVMFPLVLLSLAYLAFMLLARSLPVAVFKIAIPVLVALAVIRLGVKVLQVVFVQSPVVRILERSISWVAWLVMVLWVSGLLPLVLEELDDIRWKVGDSTLSVRTLLEGAVSACIVLIITLWISSGIEARLLKSSTGSQLSLRKALSNATRAVLLFVGLLVALSAVGIDLTALSVLGGAIGVGVGFGLQKLASNYVSGFVILAERQLRIGDNIKVDNYEGRISDINARYSVIRALNGRESIVPNEMLVINRVENISRADPRAAQTIVLSVAYGSDVDVVMGLLVEAAEKQERVLKDPAAFAALSAFGAEGLEFTLSYWITNPETGALALRSTINLAILRALEAAGIAIRAPGIVLQRVTS
ncbi:MAG TPA: mechanosensitive ion channel domain-containing protein [Polaromonas sp.]|uniref:mechanosensitive ion channel family protein n=1 Tax=Polaromonas sp. TaxID=1869339 RepID=UPI002D4B10E0|nr:mechanosensitive ion channel domain-containing protein [Polaromonas sp.]HYW57359.1 mechanosensitive ion channel domain-containing protein [Polaromonas sp.]